MILDVVSSLEARRAVVLDTNVVLDWLVFADVHTLKLGRAISDRRVFWLATPHMRDELTRVLGYANLARWAPDVQRVLATFDRCAQLCSEPPFCGWVCADKDDQVFVDLAVAHQVHALITHDRALLALARRVRAGGLAIIKPSAWRELGDGSMTAARDG